MLKKRIAATLVIKNNIVVQSKRFSHYLPVGKPAIAVEFLDEWGIDEIILLDIEASTRGDGPDLKMIKEVSKHCRVPLTVGGGITTIDHISQLMHCGADKVAVNQAAIFQPRLIMEAAQVFGAQCVVASIDAVKSGGTYVAYDYLRKMALPTSVAELASHLEQIGAGEIFINSVDRDGTGIGFDLELISSVCNAVRVPVICCGGAGSPKHLIEALVFSGVSAVSAGNFYHFTEHSVTIAKSIVSQQVPIRHETYVDYSRNTFDGAGRILKREESELNKLLYQRIEIESI